MGRRWLWLPGYRMGTLSRGRYAGVSRYARVAALLVGHKTIPARGLGATCGLAGGQFVMAGHAAFLHHYLAVPYQTDAQISGVRSRGEGHKAGLSFAIAPRHRSVLPDHSRTN